MSVLVSVHACCLYKDVVLHAREYRTRRTRIHVLLVDTGYCLVSSCRHILTIGDELAGLGSPSLHNGNGPNPDSGIGL